jgi:hypothetical protein
MNNLVGTEPEAVLIHGPKKLMITKYLWHAPAVGIVASYSPREIDVEDHFGVFRGVDMVESFAQATTGSCGAYIETVKQKCSFQYLKDTFYPAFIGVGQVIFHNYLELGDTFISVGHIKHYKFRQMVCDGRIYKVPPGLDLDEYFSRFNEERLLGYDLEKEFKLIAELFGVTGRGIKKEKFK